MQNTEKNTNGSRCRNTALKRLVFIQKYGSYPISSGAAPANALHRDQTASRFTSGSAVLTRLTISGKTPKAATV